MLTNDELNLISVELHKFLLQHVSNSPFANVRTRLFKFTQSFEHPFEIELTPSFIIFIV